MEKCLVPKRKKKLVKWLLQTAAENVWAIAFEYSEEGTTKFLKCAATEVPLPLSANHNYELDNKLMAVNQPDVTNHFVKEIMQTTHVVSAHDEKGMIFLFADDYHKHGLTCSVEFHDKYFQLLCDEKLIECRQ